MKLNALHYIKKVNTGKMFSLKNPNINDYPCKKQTHNYYHS